MLDIACIETAPSKVIRKIQKLNFPVRHKERLEPTRTGTAAIQNVFGRINAIQAEKECGLICKVLVLTCYIQ